MTTDFLSPFQTKLIRASAGTGKTFELSSRYIALLAAGVNPDRILATTFTRKAAGEICDRVFTRLADAALDQNAARAMGEQISQPDFDAAKASQVLRRLADRQHHLNICTLDSFFMLIARSFAFELGFLNEWSIGYLGQMRLLWQEAIRAVCEEQGAEKLTPLMRFLRADKFSRKVQSALIALISGLQQLYRETDRAAWHWLVPPPRLKLSEIERVKQTLAAMPLPRTQKGEINKGWQKAITNALSDLEAEDWESFMTRGLAPKIGEGVGFSSAPISDEVKEVFQPLIRQAMAALLSRVQMQTSAAYDLLSLLEEQLEKLRMHFNLFSFDDIKFRLLQAALASKSQELYYRLDSQISHLLLDEFQDTSRLDWAVLKPMVEEMRSKADGSGNCSFFCVGDQKQAIYGWRGGVAEIFDTLEDVWGVESESRETSRRSAPAIIDTVNAVFSAISANRALRNYPAAAESWQQRFNPHATTHTNCPGYAVLLSVTGEGPKTGATDSPLERRTIELVAHLQKAAPQCSIAILTRTNEPIARLIYHLSRQDPPVPASGEGGNALTDSPAVCATISALTAAEHPGDTKALYHLANGALGAALGLTDHADEQRVNSLSLQIRSRLADEGFGEVVHSWGRQISGAISERDHRRVMQLVELAHKHDLNPGARVMDFVATAEKARVEDPASSNVRVMTIHQAKGLEFDIVILPQLEKSILGPPVDRMLAHRPEPLASPDKIAPYPSEVCRLLSPQLSAVLAQNQSEKLKESLSILYVAMTRARHALYMLIPQINKPDEPPLSQAGVLYSALAEGLNSDGVAFERGDSCWFKGVPAQKPRHVSAEQTGGPLRLVYKDIKRRALQHETPSSLEGGEIRNLARIFQPHGADAKHRGTVIHAFFSCITWLDQGMPSDEELLGACRGIPLTPGESKGLLSEFKAFLRNPGIAGVLKRSQYDMHGDGKPQVRTEHPFAVRLGETILNGSIDRLVVCSAGGKPVYAEVLDFKTDSFLPGDIEEIKKHVNLYSPQLKAYAAAAAQITGLAPRQIKTKLVFVAPGIVEIV